MKKTILFFLLMIGGLFLFSPSSFAEENKETEERLQCTMTIISDKHSFFEPAFPDGVCKGYVKGYFVVDDFGEGHFHIIGMATYEVTYSGQQFEIGIPLYDYSPILTVYTILNEESKENTEKETNEENKENTEKETNEESKDEAEKETNEKSKDNTKNVNEKSKTENEVGVTNTKTNNTSTTEESKNSTEENKNLTEKNIEEDGSESDSGLTNIGTSSTTDFNDQSQTDNKNEIVSEEVQSESTVEEDKQKHSMKFLWSTVVLFFILIGIFFIIWKKRASTTATKQK
ncbi:hypothetical protein [Fervidibacillus albus]|uniref:Uncharacterized protein n=1 Tax=Fervidibacillus albus TaxID=2980026 RepID=A0A9E8RVW1_9BACI|nr:hypothetical protein [Fervidibacillus albus]WAA09916.1 hypothetical protein OE104_00605 [Fervidibacillus albus]